MFEDIKSGTVVNGVKVIHVKTKSPREQFLYNYADGRIREILARDYAKEKATKRMLAERDSIVKRMFEEYEEIKSKSIK